MKSSTIGEGDIIATLPAGFRPKYTVQAYMVGIGASIGNGIAQVDILPSGTVRLNWIVDHKNDGSWRWIVGKAVYIAE